MGLCESERRNFETINIDINDISGNKVNENEVNNKKGYDNSDEGSRVNQVIINKFEEDKNNKKEPKKGNFIEINRYLTQICKSICKLQINLPDDKYIIGTGFLLKFLIENKYFFCLITNYHVINKEIIDSKRKLFFLFNFENERRSIILDTKQRIIKGFENLDITVIELLDIDDINEYFFLTPNLDYNIFINKEIYIPQYPGGNELCYSEGNIEPISSFELIHNANTLEGSSGSPIFLKNTTTVIGIHKQGNSKKLINFGSFIHSIIILFKEEYIKYKCEKFEGNHEFIYDDGSYYIGFWKNGLRNGKGKLFDKNGKLIYEGDWVNDKREGFGKCGSDPGHYYIGQLKNNCFNGKGKLYDNEGKLLYEGDFVNNEIEGFGKLKLEDNYYYLGELKNRKPNGKGKVYNNNGFLLYEGDFVNGDFEGLGRFNYYQGFYYIGQWKNHFRHGLGKYYDIKGNLRYDGGWVNDKPEGIGKIIQEDGKYYYGEIKNGKREGRGYV